MPITTVSSITTGEPKRLAPVTISVRQVDPTGIPDQNWQNLHLRERYVAGVGVVASVANSRTQEGRPEMLVRGLPPEAVKIAEEAGPSNLHQVLANSGVFLQGRYELQVLESICTYPENETEQAESRRNQDQEHQQQNRVRNIQLDEERGSQ